MKSKILIDNKNKDEYNVLFKVEAENKKNYVVYTKNEKNKDGEIIAYAASYSMCEGKQILEPVEDDNVLEFLDGILLQVQNKMNKGVKE